MWQGHLFIKNDGAAVQLHFLSGNVQLASLSLPQAAEQRTPNLRISQRMRLENSQLEGVDRRMQVRYVVLLYSSHSEFARQYVFITVCVWSCNCGVLFLE